MEVTKKYIRADELQVGDFNTTKGFVENVSPLGASIEITWTNGRHTVCDPDEHFVIAREKDDYE